MSRKEAIDYHLKFTPPLENIGSFKSVLLQLIFQPLLACPINNEHETITVSSVFKACALILFAIQTTNNKQNNEV